VISEKMDKRVSDQVVDYAAFIVYYKKGHAASDQIASMASPYGTEIIMQEVGDIAPDRKPEWLRGVPTVVKLPEYSIYRGTEALAAIEGWCEGQLGGARAEVKGTASAVHSAPLALDDPRDMPLLAEDPRYSDGKTRKRSQEADFGQPSSIEELMRLRAPKGGLQI
jgi:hypothetical protein